MRLIPFQQLNYHVALKPNELRSHIGKHIGEPVRRPRSILPIPFDAPYPWEGRAVNEGFRIRRVIEGRNAFMPHVYGTVTPTPTGSDVRVRLTLSPSAALLIAAFLLTIILGLTVYVVNAGERSTFVGNARLVPLVLVVAGYYLLMIRFEPEADKAREFMDDLMASATRE